VSSLLFQPPPPTKLKENKIVWLKTSLGKKIPGFYIHYNNDKGEESSKSLTVKELQSARTNEGITILYSHANAEDLGSIYPWCKFLSKMLRVNLFAYDYTGYGMAFDEGKACRVLLSSREYAGKFAHIHFVGNPSEDDCYADIDAAYKFLRFDLDIPAQNIVLYGRSLGSGPSCHLAAGTAQSKDPKLGGPVGGVILHAPFLSVYRIVLDTGCTVYGDKFPNIDYAPSIESPLILVHGTADQIVPFNHSERMYQALPPKARARPLFIEGMGHNNVHSVVRPMFVTRLNDFLDEKVWPKIKTSKALPCGRFEEYDDEESSQEQQQVGLKRRR